MLGLIMEIIIFLMGIYYFIRGNLEGLILIGVAIFLWIIGFVWDKVQFKDSLYSWKQLMKLFVKEEKNEK